MFIEERFNADPARWWNQFYKNNTTNFFKDRKWLQQEFPVLATVTGPDAPATTVVELGAGAGNTAFPILVQNRNPRLKLFAYDFSRKAVELMRADPRYDGELMRADVWDVAATPSITPERVPGNDEDKEEERDPTLPPGLTEGSVDIVLLIFVFSALSPTQWTHAVRNIHRLLRPGGEVLLRDYARGDLAQVRFRKGRYMDENFYVRGDGTRVYFFDRDELARIWSDCEWDSRGDVGNGVEEGEGDGASTGGTAKLPEEEEHDVSREEKGQAKGGFKVLNLDLDKRLLVNRQRKLKMYRCWIQGRFKKIDVNHDEHENNDHDNDHGHENDHDHDHDHDQDHKLDNDDNEEEGKEGKEHKEHKEDKEDNYRS